MDLFDVLREDCVQVGMAPASKDEMLREIARLARQSPALATVGEDELFAALHEREELGSTAFGDGVAIPHCRLAGATEFVAGIVSVPGGVDFHSLDGEPVHLLFFIVAPAEESSAHIRLLSTISRVVATRGVKEELLAEKTGTALREAFLRHVPDELQAAEEGHERAMVTIFVQNEEHFTEILEVVSSLASSSVAVIEAGSVGRYLHAVPLFSTFWSADDRGFHRIITGVIAKRLANEVIRGVDTAVGGLEQHDGVLVTIHDVQYVNGSLRN